MLWEKRFVKKIVVASLAIMLHSQHNVSKFFIKLHFFLMLLKFCIFFPKIIHTSSLGHLRCIDDELFIIIKKVLETLFYRTLHYLQNILFYIIIEYKIHYISSNKTFKKNLPNFKNF